jgi:hypothetical protein
MIAKLMYSLKNNRLLLLQTIIKAKTAINYFLSQQNNPAQDLDGCRTN